MHSTKKNKLKCLFFSNICLILFLLFSTCSVYSPDTKESKSGLKEPVSIEDNVILANDVVDLNYYRSFQQGRLVDSQFLSELSVEQIQAIGAGFEPFIKYGVKIYKISYLTKYKGAIIRASGAVSIPVLTKGKKASIVVYNHGTKFSDGDLLPSSGMDIGLVLTASDGYICFAADYIGYGDSEDIFHPYLINEASNNAVCDMIIAGRWFLSCKKILPRCRLFMYGFSEGGLVTMAAQRNIENNPFYKHRIRLTAVAAGMGPYDLYDLAVYPVIASETYPVPAYLLFLFIAYNDYYKYGRSLDDLFKNSYGQLYQELIEQDLGYFDLIPYFPTSVTDLLQDDFRADFLAGRTEFNIAIEKNNSIDGWVPKSPLKIYHSPADEQVSYANAQAAYDSFVDAGAASVELITLPPVDHINSAGYAVYDILPWFGSF
jgi:hypothetical protein